MFKKMIAAVLALSVCVSINVTAFADGYVEVVPPMYDDSSYGFSDGLLAVEIGGKWGLIDQTGEIVVPIKYTDVGSFYEGLASVVDGGLAGYIDQTGKEIVPPKYWGYVYFGGSPILPNFSDGLARVNEGSKMGYIDKTGAEVVPPKYDGAQDFSEGFAGVFIGDKWGYIDSTGKEITPFKYDYAGHFSDGFAVAEIGGKYGVIDKTGKEITPFKYEKIWGSFIDGYRLVSMTVPVNDEYINKTGVNPNFVRQYIVYGYIDKTGAETMLNFHYYNHMTPSFDGSLFTVSEDDSYLAEIEAHRDGTLSPWSIDSSIHHPTGIVDRTGKVIVPFKYFEIGHGAVSYAPNYFSENMAVVSIRTELDVKYGYIDKTGKEIVTPKYDSAANFRNGLAIVEIDGKEGCIDYTGKEVVSIKYDEIFIALHHYDNNILGYRLGEKWGGVSRAGVEITPAKYDETLYFKNGYAHFKIGEKYGVVDETGKEVVPTIYDYIGEVNEDGFAPVRLGGKAGIISIQK